MSTLMWQCEAPLELKFIRSVNSLLFGVGTIHEPAAERRLGFFSEPLAFDGI